MKQRIGETAFLITVTAVALSAFQAPAVPGAVVPPTAPGAAPAGRGAQPQAPAGRGGVSTAPAGTAIVRGRVTAADSGVPLRRAQVRLARGGGWGVVGTDDQGRFEFTGLPSGSYTINAAKTGYVTLSLGQTGLSEPPRSIDLADGQVIPNVNLALPRGGVIVATVTDAYGEPVAGVRVDAMQYRLVNGQRRLLPSPTGAPTNDLGQVRVPGLPPGSYYVQSTAPNGVAVAGRNMAYAPTFHPGTTDAREAQRVEVGAGQEASVAFSLSVVKLATVSGTLHKSDGTPISALTAPSPTQQQYRFNMALRDAVPTGGSQFFETVRPDASGRFTVPNVRPGDYVLEVRPSSGPVATLVNGVPQPPVARPPDGTQEYASVPVTVAGADINNLDVTTRRGATLSGQIIFDTRKTPADRTPSDLSVIMYFTGSEQPLSSGATVMHDDFSFEVTGVVATGIVRLAQTTTGWYTKSVIIDGKEVVQTPIEFEPGRDYRNIQLTLTQKRSEVNGTVADGRGRAVADYTVVLFPEERAWWYPRSRVILTARPDQSGHFKIGTLPDGKYLIAALSALEQGADQDAETLARIAPRANRLSLGEGEVKTIALQLQDVR